VTKLLSKLLPEAGAEPLLESVLILMLEKDLLPAAGNDFKDIMFDKGAY